MWATPISTPQASSFPSKPGKFGTPHSGDPRMQIARCQRLGVWHNSCRTPPNSARLASWRGYSALKCRPSSHLLGAVGARSISLSRKLQSLRHRDSGQTKGRHIRRMERSLVGSYGLFVFLNSSPLIDFPLHCSAQQRVLVGYFNFTRRHGLCENPIHDLG
jgi:hypothetical protein